MKVDPLLILESHLAQIVLLFLIFTPSYTIKNVSSNDQLQRVFQEHNSGMPVEVRSAKLRSLVEKAGWLQGCSTIYDSITEIVCACEIESDQFTNILRKQYIREQDRIRSSI